MEIMLKQQPTRTRASVLFVAIAVAAGAATAATADTGGPLETQIAALKRQVAALKRQNRQLIEHYSPAGIARQLKNAKTALDKYQSVEQASTDGYTPDAACVFFPGGAGNASSDQGAMGVHFVNPAILTSGKARAHQATRPRLRPNPWGRLPARRRRILQARRRSGPHH